jgi:hypothetical protein
MGGQIEWESFLTEADRDILLAMLDACQAASEPLILVPHYLHPHEAALVAVDFDSVEMSDVHEWQTDDAAHRSIGMTIPFAGVIA